MRQPRNWGRRKPPRPPHRRLKLPLSRLGGELPTPNRGLPLICLLRANGDYQPHIGGSDSVAILHFRHPLQKRVLALQNLKSGLA